MKGVMLLTLISLATAAVPRKSHRIVGGSGTTINEYPMAAALLHSWSLSNYVHSCGGTILNSQSVLTATHCVYFDTPANWRIRVGSTFGNSGGSVHTIERFIIHQFEYMLLADITILRSDTFFEFSDVVAQGAIAGPNYVVPDNDEVWAIGWGVTFTEKPEQLQHVQMFVVNEDICRDRYGPNVSSDQICAGLLDVGGQSQCTGDSGGPVFHHNVVVGVTSFGYECGGAYFPGVSSKVSSFSTWIQANA